MANIRVPRWILAQMCLPAGRRTGKKPVFKAPCICTSSSSHWSTPKKKEGYASTDIPGVFENWEYRFWAMTSWPLNTNVFAECRCCSHTEGEDITLRRLHFKQGKCTRKLIAAYKLLQKDSLCVICDHRTNHEKWGVPLCSSSCEQAFCETEAQPKALTAALLLVGEEV